MTKEKGPGGERVERIIDLALARDFSSQHQLSTSLAARALSQGKVVSSTEMDGDDLLRRLKDIKVETACAVPLAGVRGDASGEDLQASSLDTTSSKITTVLVFYTSQKTSLTSDHVRIVV